MKQEKRAPYARQSNPALMERDYRRIPSGNDVRHGGGWSHQQQPPPRGHLRRPPSPNFDRPGGMRRAPPPAASQSMRRSQRGPSPPQHSRMPPPPQHRDMDPAFRRRDESGRPDHFTGDRDRRPHGLRPESDSERRVPMSAAAAAGRYGDHGRDPPPSPGRNVKRQRQSPQAEQRYISFHEGIARDRLSIGFQLPP